MPPLLQLAQNKHASAARMLIAATTDHVRASGAEALALALPKDIDEGLHQAVVNGELVSRFHTALELAKKRGLEGDVATAAALFALMHEQGARAARWISDQGQAWRADAFRAEGARAELLAVAGELEQLLAQPVMVGEASPGPDVPPGGALEEASAPEPPAAPAAAEGGTSGERAGETR